MNDIALAPTRAPATIGELLRDPTLANRVQAIAVPGYDASRLLRETAAVLRANPPLRAVTPASLLIAVVGIASVGLSLAPLAGECYLVPRRNKRDGTIEATLMIGKNGWIALALRTGRVVDVFAHCVHERDAFSLKLGGGYHIEHSPYLDGDRGPIIAAYGVAELVSGARRVVFMDRSDIAAVRAMADERSEAWRRFEGMMIEKVATKRVARLVAGGHSLIARADAAEHNTPIDASALPELDVPALSNDRALDADAPAQLDERAANTQERVVLTYSRVADAVVRAETSDALGLARDLIRSVADEGQREELRALAAEREKAISA